MRVAFASVNLLHMFCSIGGFGMSIQEFQGSIATFSWCIALVLIVVSGTMCKHYRYRTLFMSFQVIQALISSLDLLLVCVAKDAFWGHFVALSDRAGTLGIQKLKFVVMACVISDRIERGGEATATSMLMMMANWPEFLVSSCVYIQMCMCMYNACIGMPSTASSPVSRMVPAAASY